MKEQQFVDRMWTELSATLLQCSSSEREGSFGGSRPTGCWNPEQTSGNFASNFVTLKRLLFYWFNGSFCFQMCVFLVSLLPRITQELSYRKQIARQLRTQYVEGIHRPKYYTVTLKSRLRITQGHWKRIHWTDHTRFTIDRVISR